MRPKCGLIRRAGRYPAYFQAQAVRGKSYAERKHAMKNIHELLKELGLEIPADKKADFDKAHGENYKTISEFTQKKDRLAAVETQLTEAKESLKSFEGVDVSALNGKITELTNSLAAKESEYQKKLADMEFDAALDSAISASGARNGKAVRALLDMDALKASKNRDGDIKAALDKAKADNDYMFTSNEPIHNPTGTVNTGAKTGNPLAAIRAAMGLPAEK